MELSQGWSENLVNILNMAIGTYTLPSPLKGGLGQIGAIRFLITKIYVKENLYQATIAKLRCPILIRK